MINLIRIISCFLVFHNCIGQTFIPTENSRLNFTQVLFKTEEIAGASSYLFILEEIEDSTLKLEQWDSTHVTIIERLDFGRNYRWYAEAYSGNGELLKKSRMHSFTIASTERVDEKSYQFVILKNEVAKREDGIIFLDKNTVAINRQGQVVWYLPFNEGERRNERLRDLKMTQEGTITYLAPNEGVEVSVENAVIWKSPNNGIVSGDSVEYYHHEFTKLPNGNYLTLGKLFEDWNLTINDQVIKKIPFTVVIEYNALGDTLWTWSSRNYFKESDILNTGEHIFLGDSYGHANSVIQSEDGKLIYLGFRDLNTVLVIDKQLRKVVNSYGDKINADSTLSSFGFFKKQHAAVPFDSNKIVVFNNNLNTASSVLVFTETDEKSQLSQKIWEFVCDFDTLMPSYSEKMGNVQVLKNGNFLVNMGSVARLFEVTNNNEVVWNCLPQKWNRELSIWQPITNYRINYQRSLYPKYFSVSLRKDSNNNDYFLIQNEGSENDSYTVSFSMQGKKVKDEVKLYIPSDNGEKVYVKDYFSEKQRKKEITIRVISNSNSRQVYERKMNFQ